MFQDSAIYLCTFCGERLTGKGKYCKVTCSTKAGRDEVDRQNAEVRADFDLRLGRVTIASNAEEAIKLLKKK